MAERPRGRCLDDRLGRDRIELGPFQGALWHVGLCSLTAAGCLLLLPLGAKSVGFTAVLLILAVTGLYTVLGLFWPP
jgi:hypothetical protein